MGPCNSHKCHCPSCIAVEEMERCARERERQQRHLEQHFAYVLRREQWKRRARQAAVDQAGVCIGGSECPCPNCHEYREFYRLRFGESLHRVFSGRDDWGQMVKWYWVRRPGGWRRKDLKTNRIFGPFVQHVEPSAVWPVTSHHIRTRTVGGASIRDEVIVHTTNPNSADNWVRSVFTDPPAYMSLDQATEYYRNHYGLKRSDPAKMAATKANVPPYHSPLQTPEVRAAFMHGDWTEHKKEITMFNPLHIAILAHFNVNPGVPYPYTSPVGSVSQALEELITAEFLIRSPDRAHQLTGRACTFLHAVEALPLPIRKPAPWVMPD